jgi:hypothetical protein
MISLQAKTCALFAAAILMPSSPALPQAATSEPADSARTPRKSPQGPAELETRGRPVAPRPKAKSALSQATHISTEEAMRKAAADLAKKPNGQSVETKAAAPKAADSTVLEFRPADRSQSTPTPAVTRQSKNSKKSPLKNAHGSIYGSAGAGSASREIAGSAGASSKSGATSIYVETDQSRASPSH